MSTLFLSRKDVRGLLDMELVIESVEQAFRDWALGKAKMPAKAYLDLDKGDFRAMPAALTGSAGMKWVNVHSQNPSLGLPTVMGIMIYSDPLNGYALAVMDATDITAYRTGAVAAIASKYLARRDSKTLGIVGAGQQAYTQLLAHAKLFELKSVKVFDLLEVAVQKLITAFPEYEVRAASLEETVASDIVCTVTPAREPFVSRELVIPGTHINAIGADAPGKEELEPTILKEALVVVDNMEQASAAGEINVPLKKGLLRLDQVHATLDEIIVGKRESRRDEKVITVFDSTGLAIHDIATARLVYDKAKEIGGYLSLDFVEG